MTEQTRPLCCPGGAEKSGSLRALEQHSITMGAGASALLAEFGPLGDVNAVRSLCARVGKEFDQVKFDELKVKPQDILE